ncbi:hypothetical protein SAMN04488505_101213 [Chitinophaga rupis]|uniref:Uncharacterized protein n=1 Tax=Chitinophaga rupis TaxID=573321 RepID=A0A1H7H2H1_9BACT|nr:hypothetical protein SAMN04488505_101213 [Chitinophaga rupis]
MLTQYLKDVSKKAVLRYSSSVAGCSYILLFLRVASKHVPKYGSFAVF